MNPHQLERCRRELYGRRQFRAADRRAAAAALAHDASAAALRVLLDAILEGRDPLARAAALDALRRLADWRCVNAVCAAWAATRNADLAAVIVERGWVASSPASLRVLSALRADRGELLAASRASAVLPLVHACDDHDPVIAGRARAALIRLERPEAREALCRLAIERDLPVAREAALVAGFTPAAPRERALFLFLTGQWELYRRADPDGALLGEAYAAADQTMRERIATQAGRARLTAWARSAASAPRAVRPADMSPAEWEAVTAGAGARPADAWALAQVAPPVYAARLLRQLAAACWSPDSAAEQPRFASLTKLAVACGEPPTRVAHPLGSIAAHRRAVTRLAFSPDGRVLASGGADGAVQLWAIPHLDAAGGGRHHPWTIAGLQFSPDGALLLSASVVGALLLWRIAGPGPWSKATPLDGRFPAAFVPGTPLLACAGASGGLELRRVADGAHPPELRISDAGGRLTALAVSPDGRMLAGAMSQAAGPNGSREHAARSVRLWRLADGSLAGVLAAGSAPVKQLVFGPGGRTVATADERVRVWSVADGMLLADLEWRPPLAFVGDEAIVGVGPDGCLRLWQGPGSLRPLRLQQRPAGPVTCVALSDNRRLLAAGAPDGTVELWLLPEGRALGSLPGDGQATTSLAWSPCGRFLAAGDARGGLRLWAVGAAAFCGRPPSALEPGDIASIRDTLYDPETPADERPWLALAMALAARPGSAPRASEERAERRIAAGALEIVLA